MRAEVLGYPVPMVQFFKDKSEEPLISQAQLHRTAKNPTGYYELVAENCHGIIACHARVMPKRIIPDLIGGEALVGLPPSGVKSIAPDVVTDNMKSVESNSSSKSDLKSTSSVEYIRPVGPSVGLTASPFKPTVTQGGPYSSGGGPWIEPPQRDGRKGSNQSGQSIGSQNSGVIGHFERQGSLAELRESIRNRKSSADTPLVTRSNEFDSGSYEDNSKVDQKRRLAPNFQNSIDRADEDIDESRKPFIKKVEISPFTQNLAPLTPLAPPTIAPNVPSHTGAPLAYRFPRASSPQDSEYYSEYYESCMETPTGSPIG